MMSYVEETLFHNFNFMSRRIGGDPKGKDATKLHWHLSNTLITGEEVSLSLFPYSPFFLLNKAQLRRAQRQYSPVDILCVGVESVVDGVGRGGLHTAAAAMHTLPTTHRLLCL